MNKYSRLSEEAFVMEITPEMATEMLDTSTGNRKTRPWWVAHLAAAGISH